MSKKSAQTLEIPEQAQVVHVDKHSVNTAQSTELVSTQGPVEVSDNQRPNLWKKGQSGNPSGLRAKVVITPEPDENAVALAQRRLLNILRTKKSKDGAVIAAAKEIYDRIEGKAKQKKDELQQIDQGTAARLVELVNLLAIVPPNVPHSPQAIESTHQSDG